MPDYRRNRVPGGTYFFTINLRDRRSDLLVVEIAALRDAVRTELARRPFHIDAWVVLPDHMHCQWTLPEGDADFFRAYARHQGGLYPTDCTANRTDDRDFAATGKRHLAAAILGTHDQGRPGLCGPYGLYPFQPGEAWAGQGGAGLGILVISAMCGGGFISVGMGWH